MTQNINRLVPWRNQNKPKLVGKGSGGEALTGLESANSNFSSKYFKFMSIPFTTCTHNQVAGRQQCQYIMA